MQAEKTRKQPTIKNLREKAETLFLDVDIYRDNDKIVIANNYSNEVFYKCNTPIGASRKLTEMYWDRMIKKLRNLGDIA